MRFHALTSVVFHILYCKGQFTPDTLKLDSLATLKGTAPGREPPPGEASERGVSGGAGPALAALGARTAPGAQMTRTSPVRTSPVRRSPEPGFDDFPRFSYPESYRDHVYRDLSKRVKEVFFVITVRTYDLVEVLPLRFYSVSKYFSPLASRHFHVDSECLLQIRRACLKGAYACTEINAPT